MNLFAHFQTLVRDELVAMAAEGLLPPGLDLSRVTAEPPREAAHGDVASNAAMVLARPAGQNPRALAEALAARLAGRRDVARAEVAGPGFINLTLKPEFWPRVLSAILEQGEAYG
ncbi:MAG TPA: arginine--tRNA ligase, partial [Aestuariivirga sp.]|nr:arginine--tRNA ligase [Aestuariivirga sp.]